MKIKAPTTATKGRRGWRMSTLWLARHPLRNLITNRMVGARIG